MNNKKLDYLFKKEVIDYIKNTGRHSKNIDILDTEISIKLNNVTFRKLKEWSVELEILYGLMWVRNINTASLAETLGCTTRTVQRYIFEGYFVPEEVKIKISKIFELPVEVLFCGSNVGEYNYRK